MHKLTNVYFLLGFGCQLWVSRNERDVRDKKGGNPVWLCMIIREGQTCSFNSTSELSQLAQE